MVRDNYINRSDFDRFTQLVRDTYLSMDNNSSPRFSDNSLYAQMARRLMDTPTTTTTTTSSSQVMRPRYTASEIRTRGNSTEDYIPVGTISDGRAGTISSWGNIIDKDNYVKLDDTISLDSMPNFKLASKEFRDFLAASGLSDISDKDNQTILKVADSLLHRLGRVAEKNKRLKKVAEDTSDRLTKRMLQLESDLKDAYKANAELTKKLTTLENVLAWHKAEFRKNNHSVNTNIASDVIPYNAAIDIITEKVCSRAHSYLDLSLETTNLAGFINSMTIASTYSTNTDIPLEVREAIGQSFTDNTATIYPESIRVSQELSNTNNELKVCLNFKVATYNIWVAGMLVIGKNYRYFLEEGIHS